MRALVLAALAWAFATTTSAAPLRIAEVAPVAGPCGDLPGDAPVGQKAYYGHLAKRLGVPVLRCPVKDTVAAAAALAAGQADLAVLDPAAFAPVKGTTRSILTLRPEGALNRVMVIVGVKATSPAKSLADLKGKALGLGGRTPAALALPRRALADRGAAGGYFTRELIEADEQDAGAALRAGKVDVIALHAAAWQRLCPKVSPKKPKPCADLRILARIRPQAPHALVVRQDMPLETRYRLIGIHMPLHLENKAAFAWASAWLPKAAEFEAAEAQALLAAP